MKRPNLIQRLMHRFIMLKPVTAFFATRTHLVDGFVLKLTNGQHSLSEILGWNIVQITTIGAKTGGIHKTILVAVMDGETIALIGSNFGRQHNPGWYYNLKKHPNCEAQLNGVTRTYLARETEGEERETYWNKAVALYAGYEKYRQRAAHRHIPVMLLEPIK